MSGLGHTTPLQGSPIKSSRPSLDGRVIAGKYQLMRLLGEGGMGAVYEALHTTTHKRCAVKLLITPELAAHPGIVKRFFREAKASSIAESDHIVQVFDSGTDPADSLPYMVMELLSGQDLDALLKTAGAVEPAAAVKLVLQAATGLAKAHERGIVHRDIKPANLYLTQRDNGEITVKLLDFGIAKVKMENFAETSQGLTKSGSMMGTPLYMSPEQARGKKDIDSHTDVWSLGVVLYVLLAGELPYNSDTLGDLLVAIITTDPPLLQDRAPWVPPEIAEVVHRAMHREPGRRYADAAQLRDALAAISPGGSRLYASDLVSVSGASKASVAPRLAVSAEGLLIAGTRTGMSVTQEAPTPAPVKRQRSTFGVVAAVVVALVVGGVGGAKLLRARKRDRREAAARSEQPQLTPDKPKFTEITPLGAAQPYELGIIPDNAEVTIDGNRVDVKNGKVEISGTLGETRNVKLTVGGKTKEQTVAVSQNGLVPDRIELVVSARTEPRGRKGAKSEPTPQKVETEPTTKPKGSPATEKPKPKVDTSQDEFNK
ncbi:MAG: serine/threonine protein kinase [Myxococcales bacterium]|nr:serine/threonine protein kinase [Myxococcales bacterium]